MMELLDLTFLIPAFPLLGFVTLVVIGRRLGEPAAGYLATAAMAGSFGATLLVFIGLVTRDDESRGLFHGEGPFVQTLFEWIPAGDFTVDIGFLVDPLAVTMCLFITGVGTLIHLYSIGYMHGDENFSKFFIYLNLFAFSMLLLVLGDNMLLTFLGWEGVGACSYLLISFWFENPANATAGKKAFVTNRIGDWGFMVAMFAVFFTFGSISYAEFLPEADGLAQTTATAIAVLLLIGAAGKSAQLPLYLWLPDAMAGPTPVSALIHAATMVTSGVYLLTRMNPVLDAAAGWVPMLVAWVGALTALFAATIAVGQNDIKKVLAYSTVSQLGYMFLAVGTGAYVAAIFHMVTHAFFKALLFLGSGSVIHGMDGDQDMRHYGGLKKFMPITAGTFIIGWLAIAGVPPFAGFWSKDEILLGAWDLGGFNGKALWAVGLLTALLTAFYMSRQVFMTFFGRYRYGDVQPEEVDAAWEAKIASADETATTARKAADDATAAIAAAETKVTTATEAVPTAEAALAEADDEGREAASTAVEKAREALVAARSAENDARAAADESMAAAVEAERAAERIGVDAQNGRTITLADDGEWMDAPDAVADHLPESVQARREYHPHESPWTMTAPLGILAIASMVAGVMNLPFTKWWHHLDHWLEPSLLHEHTFAASASTKWILAIVAIAAGVIGIATAAATYLQGRIAPGTFEKPVLADGWGYDRAITAFMGGPGHKLFDAIAWFDANVVDGIVNGAGQGVRGFATPLRRVQSGLVRSYAAGIGIGGVLLIGWFLLRASL